jgi:signal peptidase
MEPTYHRGDAVLAWCGAPHEGDVVVYRPPGVANLQVIHRVVGGDASGWLTEGDNNRGPDPFTPTNDDVVGIARIHVPNVGTALHQLTSPAVWGGLIVVGVAILVWPGRRLEAPTPPGPA